MQIYLLQARLDGVYLLPNANQIMTHIAHQDGILKCHGPFIRISQSLHNLYNVAYNFLLQCAVISLLCEINHHLITRLINERLRPSSRKKNSFATIHVHPFGCQPMELQTRLSIIVQRRPKKISGTILTSEGMQKLTKELKRNH